MKHYLLRPLMGLVLVCLSSHAVLANDEDQMSSQISDLKKQLQQQQEIITQLQQALNQIKGEQAGVLRKVEQIQKNSAVTTSIASAVPAQKLAADPAAAPTYNVTSSQPITINMKSAPNFATADGQYTFAPMGGVQVDYGHFEDDKTDHPDGATLRYARVGFKGTVKKDIAYKAEFDFGNRDEDDSTAIKDLYIAYTGFKNPSFRVGNFKPAFGLDQLLSSTNTTFAETALPITSFGSSYILGAQAYGGSDHYSWAIGAHNDVSTTKSSDDEARSLVARLTASPINGKDRHVHAGVSASYRVPSEINDRFSFSSAAENSLQQKRSVSTGDINGVDHATLVGLEAAGGYGPFSVRGEYFHTQLDSAINQDPNFNGWYMQASWFLTGESASYKPAEGLFGAVEPLTPFDLASNHWGAVELASRYSAVDLNDGLIAGGEVEDITLGVNWYLNANTRLMANYIMVNTDDVEPAGNNVEANDDPNLMLLRAQLVF